MDSNSAIPSNLPVVITTREVQKSSAVAATPVVLASLGEIATVVASQEQQYPDVSAIAELDEIMHIYELQKTDPLRALLEIKKLSIPENNKPLKKLVISLQSIKTESELKSYMRLPFVEDSLKVLVAIKPGKEFANKEVSKTVLHIFYTLATTPFASQTILGNFPSMEPYSIGPNMEQITIFFLLAYAYKANPNTFPNNVKNIAKDFPKSILEGIDKEITKRNLAPNSWPYSFTPEKAFEASASVLLNFFPKASETPTAQVKNYLQAINYLSNRSEKDPLLDFLSTKENENRLQPPPPRKRQR